MNTGDTRCGHPYRTAVVRPLNLWRWVEHRASGTRLATTCSTLPNECTADEMGS